MGLLKFLVIAVMVVSAASYSEASTQGKDLRSAVSYVFCDEFEPTTVNFDVSVQPNSKPQETAKPRLSVTFSGTNSKEFLGGTIDQLLGVKTGRVSSSSMPEICLQSLVVDTTIFIDKPTQFMKLPCKRSSVDSNAFPCKNFESDLEPLFVCPQAMTALLKEKEIITKIPGAQSYGNSGKPPIYDITEDMAQASFAIAEGVAEGSRIVIKYRATSNAKVMSRGVESLSSFLKGLGPVLNSFGGITSIMTTFLTPNPFDELANYMNEQFSIVNKQLRDIQKDITNLELVVESQSQKLAMSTAIREIRHTTRSYQRMLAALTQRAVCDSNALLKQSEVKRFLKDIEGCDDLRNHLQDLLEVEFGGVAEANTGLLKPFMKAYCVSDPSRVTRFMKHMSMCAYGGTLALFTYENLVCLKNRRRNCADLNQDKKDWLEKLHRFTKKTELYSIAVKDPVRGLSLDMEDDLELVIHDAVNRFIINKLDDKHDWPYNCIVKPNDDKVIIIGVAQTNAHVFGTSFKPWALKNVAKLENVLYTVVKAKTVGYTKKKFEIEYTGLGNLMKIKRRNGGEESFISCSNGGCVFRPWRLNGVPPNAESNDRILYFMFNPMNFKTKTGTQNVIANMVPIDVYFAAEEAMEEGGLGEIAVGCWEARRQTNYQVGWPREYRCEAPDPNSPNREKSPTERYVAMIRE